MVKWPEDFDFDVTRAINAPTAHVKDKSAEGNYEDEKKTTAFSSEENDTADDELNPVALNKAFRFAAWSSVILVSLTICCHNLYSSEIRYWC